MARKAAAAKRTGSDTAQAEELEGLSFEQLLERLTEVVEALEDGDAPLEEALSTFERGVALSRLGEKRLDEAERRIEVLLRSGRTVPLDEDEPRDRRAEELHDD